MMRLYILHDLCSRAKTDTVLCHVKVKINMAVRLHINNKDLVDQKKSELHLLPCKIHGNKAAKVSSFFKPYIRKIDKEYCNCSFRGYPFQGREVTVPAGYKGTIFVEKKKADGEGKNRNLYCTKTFLKFTYWNYDRIPSENDAIIGALDWIDIAEALHAPAT